MPATKNIIAGAGIGTVIGCLAAFLYPRRYEILEQIRENSATFNNIKNKAREYGETLLDKGKRFGLQRVEYRNRYLTGGIFGLTVGAITALLLAPKTGKALRKQLSQAYRDLSEKSEEMVHKFNYNSHPFAKTRKKRTLNRTKSKRHKVGLS